MDLPPWTNYFEVTPKVRAFTNDVKADNPLQAFQAITLKAHTVPQYQSDLEIYGRIEYFASPDRTLNKGVGDCEDLAVLILASMRALREELQPEDFRWTVGKHSKFPFPRLTIPFIGVPIPSPIPSMPWEIYHSWAEVLIDGQWYIGEGTNGRVENGWDPHYTRMFSIRPYGIEIHP